MRMTRTLLAADVITAAAARAEKLTVAMPGVPPVFGSVVTYVAKEEGFFKKHGVDVEVRNFDSGAAAAQAVVAGGIDAPPSPPPVIVRVTSNPGGDLLSFFGMQKPDWLVGPLDSSLSKRPDMKGP